MNIDEYQKHALKSVAITGKDITALAHRTLGLNGEAGILSNQIKKIIRDKGGKADEQDLEVVRKRLGDVLYYTAVLAEYFELSLSDVAENNMKQSTKFIQERRQG